MLSLSWATPSRAIAPSDVPNPRQDNGWVMDMADLLSPDSEAKLNQMITALEETNGAEIAVVTVPNTKPSASPEAYTTKLFNTWGIGKKGLDNGVLFMVSKEDRRVEIETGYGLESILPDAQVGNIIQTQVTPQFKQGNFDGGILQGTQTIIRVLKNPASSSFNQPDKRVEEHFNSMVVIGSLIVMGLMGLAAKNVIQVCRNLHSSSSTAGSNLSCRSLGRAVKNIICSAS
ncbi:YgcG family protein [Acaryochloris marina]|uniref:TPM domain-containing protein n=1 Tax=Acaryochloris marina TaxID=155978 RepID=UPI001BAE5AF6|nr:TPM domain-containing protein [Acaryochloris marina]QUY43486.1 TPM domain-containing protein [Acaryochloris marina S15]